MDISNQARKRKPNPHYLVRIFSGGVGSYTWRGGGPKGSVCPLKSRKTKLFGGISRILVGYPEGARKSADCKRGQRKGATSKNVKKFFDTFRQFSRGTCFPAPFAIRWEKLQKEVCAQSLAPSNEFPPLCIFLGEEIKPINIKKFGGNFGSQPSCARVPLVPLFGSFRQVLTPDLADPLSNCPLKPLIVALQVCPWRRCEISLFGGGRGSCKGALLRVHKKGQTTRRAQ